MNLKYSFFNLLALFIVFSSCSRFSEGSKKASEKIQLSTTALYETTAMPQDKKEDAADDPAIWVNPKNTAESRIIGTDKKGGLAVYNLQGKELFYYPHGNMNNVDLRYNFVLGEDTIDIVAASNRTTQSISIYKINEDGSLKNIASRIIKSEMVDEVYGFCMYKSPVDSTTYAFVNSKSGEVEQWKLIPEGTQIGAQLVRDFKLDTQVEGMVTDDENQTLFIGEEVSGIWKFDAEPNGNSVGEKLSQSSEEDNEFIMFDIEGLSIYYLPNGKGYIVASSQGNYSYAVYERLAPHNYIGSFKIVDGIVDGSEETDGLDIYSYSLNEDFQHGLLVVQDGYNYDEGKAVAQNFKLIPWENVAALFETKLKQN